ncbi:MAG: hypothetical protein WAT22_09015 [Saprospiraceae bacterium]|nr:hypothetical protein [Saprospiraceae bacterium]
MASLNDASTFIPRTDAFCFRYFLIRIGIFLPSGSILLMILSAPQISLVIISLKVSFCTELSTCYTDDNFFLRKIMTSS